MLSQGYPIGLWQSTWDSSQFYLGQVGSLSEPYSISLSDLRVEDAKTVFVDTLVVPAYATGASFLVLLVQLITRSSLVKGLYQKLAASEEGSTGETEDEDADEVISEWQRSSVVARHIAQYGGLVIFAYRILRLLCTLALLALTIATINLTAQRGSVSTVTTVLPQVALCLTYGYASLLGIISVVVNKGTAKLATRHLALVLAFTWAVFVYRDIWPLATFTLQPADSAEGGLLWAKFSVLTIAGVAVPLIVPRQYTPADPKNPWKPIPEQTASLLSMMLYLWLDPTVFEAYRVPHLPIERLPPLADYDSASHLVKRSFKHLDPFMVKKSRHLFFGLMTVFRKEYMVLALMMTIFTCTSFASPLGIKNLLGYLETDGEGAVVRPWVWISWLFIGPMTGSVALQWYIFTSTRTLVRTTGIITQLVFAHALRIRMKAEVPDTPASSTVTTAVGTPDNTSVADMEGPHSQSATDGEQHGPGSSEDETVRASTISSSSTKGKGKSKVPSEGGESGKERQKKSEDAKGVNLVGKINNLVTTDLDNLINGRDFLFIVVVVPLQLSLCIWFLYAILGWSAFAGMAVMVLLFPLPGWVASKIQTVQVDKMKKTDIRVQSVAESMNVIRMIKLFGWEPRVKQQLEEKREDELYYQWKYRLLGLINGCLNYAIPLVTMIVTFMTYTLIMKRELTASVVFSAMSVFDLLRNSLNEVFGLVPAIIRAKVSLDRVDEFLKKTELLDQYSPDSHEAEALIPKTLVTHDIIGVRNAAFTWTNMNHGLSTPVSPGTPGRSKRNFVLRIEDEVQFKRGHINLIVGPTGSGKTSLLMALLGEMHYIPHGPDSYYHLPRAGGVAYAAQESWVQNETIRDNILFGAPYDEERYNKVIDQCDLKRDLALFEAGDQTEVGEKGLTLSGGQKARITLARAVYSSAEILLLDDVLAALDVHTAKWIVDKCFKGDLIHSRTVLLVTHNVALASPVADFAVSLGTDGQVVSQGSMSKVLAKDEVLLKEINEENVAIEKAEHTVDDQQPAEEGKKSDGKLIVAEEISVGHVSWPALKMFFSSLGGSQQSIFWFLCVGTLVLSQICDTIQIWYLGYWARQYEDHEPSEVNAPFYISIYSGLMVATAILYSIGYVAYVYGALRASRSLHLSLIQSVLGTTLRWLDKTPTSRIITRCTQDIAAVDGPITDNFRSVAELSVAMLCKLAAVVVMTPVFLIPGALVAFLGGWLGRVYMKAQLSAKREMSNARAPVLGHFGAAIAGLTSIRAYAAQESFTREAYKRNDQWTTAARTFYTLNRWICIRIDATGALFSTALAVYLVYGGSFSASNTGFSLNMAVGFSGMILWWVRVFNHFEVAGNSLERIEQYVHIEQEPKPTTDGVPPAYWPASGDLKVDTLSARYSLDGPHVLHELSFEVKSGERVGIVGRTGSGKSSLTLSLLRCIITEGKVYYDGLATDEINLDVLRSNITIIPQVPELLSGTLRQNLDPFEQHDDAVLNDALRAAGLFNLQSETDEGRITLDSQISSGGSNLSVGQRQILALARAIVRQSKLLILDEATSAIDYATDTVIQESLRRELDKGVTLLTIAHRLQTIMDADKIMVLDAGRIVEFGSPSQLLKNSKGMLKALVDESGDRDALYAMANRAASAA
ncbi:P-loop containing nucleoside triphosphate hydrolase protein [Daedalea quercina L-15889]|uniref:p-loop containing nucleoside triphosphate hydrolase protein n=1 Tax=Daedalea quercina L-15889 TaxID=1314783 RepID=A0A165NZX1_9APHY|nr:P-loop containing nucleoside triphosphate hydrolase protein [Daedalea quercina L-15889]